MKDAKALVTHLDLETIEANIYRGDSRSIGSPRVFGGQVLAQALQAANRTVIDARLLHSMHAYFILAGDVEQPIVYEVERVRDGRSFSTRRVTGIQHGRAIFVLAASYQKSEEGFDHQISMPNVPPPEALMSDQELVELHADQLPDVMKWALSLERPIEFRPVEKLSFVQPAKERPFRHVWMRTKGELPDDPALHRSILAYASDYHLLTTAIRPHGLTWGDVFMASLDHAMWFHRDFRMDEWLLYAMDSPSASNARGFTRGNIFDQEGRLVASMVQEGLIRPIK